MFLSWETGAGREPACSFRAHGRILHASTKEKGGVFYWSLTILSICSIVRSTCGFIDICFEGKDILESSMSTTSIRCAAPIWTIQEFARANQFCHAVWLLMLTAVSWLLQSAVGCLHYPHPSCLSYSKGTVWPTFAGRVTARKDLTWQFQDNCGAAARAHVAGHQGHFI